jgi:dTDP-4-amino-4,6-dideoxygalactose transaminase
MPDVTLGTFTASALAKEYVGQVLDTGRLSYGPFCRRLESDFARIHDSQFGILSNSGTSALQVALQALKEQHGWADGDEVLVPALTFVATVNVVLHNRLTPVLVDVESDFYGIDPDKIESAITSRTRAIMPVHLFGMPCDMTRVMEIADAHGLSVVEDSCETMFARHAGRSAGSFGAIGCFSTYVAHMLVTGVGGICTTSDPNLAVILRSLVNHGRDGIYISIDDDDDPERRSMMLERRFKFDRIGHSFRITELEAALGCAALDEEWEEMVKVRRSNASYLTRALESLDDRLQLPRLRPDTEHSFMMYPLVLRDEPKRELVAFLEERGIETRDMMPILPQPCYRGVLDVEPGRYPNAELIDKSGFYVGCHQDLSQAELDHLVGTLTTWCRS